MDTKLIKEFGTEILSYRIRTARQKKRLQYEDFDKHLISLDKEETTLYKKWRKPDWKLLVPPVQQGWSRSFELSDEVASSNQAAFFSAILEKINTVQWSHKKDFKIKKRKRGRKIYVVKEQKLLEPLRHLFALLRFTDEEKQFFYPEYRIEKWCHEPLLPFVFNEPWRYVLRIRPHIIYKVKCRDGELESRLAEIHNFLWGGARDRRLYWLKQGSWKHPGKSKPEERQDERNPLKNKSLQRCLDEFRKAD